MKLIRYQDPGKFQEQVQASLLSHEAENNLQLGILATLVRGAYSGISPYLAAVDLQGQVMRIMMRTPPFPVLLSCEDSLPSPEEVELVTADLFQVYGNALSGMTGCKGQLLPYVSRWVERSGMQAQIKMAMRIYQLQIVIPVSRVAGTLRPVKRQEHLLAKKWYAAFHREVHQEESDPEQMGKIVDQLLIKGDASHHGLVVWEVGGEPVAMAGYSGPTPRGIRIRMVYTPPALRNQGYASACVASLSQTLLDEGFQRCFLFTDLANPTSNHIYQEIGYSPVVDVASYNFLSKDRSSDVD